MLVVDSDVLGEITLSAYPGNLIGNGLLPAALRLAVVDQLPFLPLVDYLDGQAQLFGDLIVLEIALDVS